MMHATRLALGLALITIWLAACQPQRLTPVPAALPSPTPSPGAAPLPPAATALPLANVLPTASPTATTPAPTATVLPTASPTAGQAESLQIRLRLAEAEMTAVLIDSSATRDLLALLPLTLTFEDHAATEKIGYLTTRLSTADAPAGYDPEPGDVAYYAPWGNLALYHRDFGYSSGLVLLGKISGSLAALSAPGALEVTIERVDEP